MSTVSFPTSHISSDLVFTYAVFAISIILSAYLLGILTVQSYKYYTTFSEDPKYLKFIIAIIFILDCAQFAASADFAWWYIVSNYGTKPSSLKSRHSSGSAAIFGASVVAIVELLFLRRIWVLSRRLLLIIPVFALIAVQYTLSIWSGVYFLQAPLLSDEINGPFVRSTTGILLGAGVAADCMTAVTLCIYLLHRRTGIERTDGILKKIVYYTMNTCLLTSVASLANIVTYYVNRQNYVYGGLNMLLCKLFSNSLLASLNYRSTLREIADRPLGISEFLIPTQREQVVSHFDEPGLTVGQLKSKGEDLENACLISSQIPSQ